MTTIAVVLIRFVLDVGRLAETGEPVNEGMASGPAGAVSKKWLEEKTETLTQSNLLKGCYSRRRRSHHVRPLRMLQLRSRVRRAWCNRGAGRFEYHHGPLSYQDTVH